MTDIVETVAMAIGQADAEEMGLKYLTSPTAYRNYMGLARAAIDAYERALREALEKSNDGCGDYGCSPGRIMDVIKEAKAGINP